MDFLRSHLIMNAPLSLDHFQSSLLGGFAVAPGLCCTHTKVMTENGQMTMGLS